MPAPHAFWVIVDGTTPTSFRAKHREDLVPTLTQLQRTQPAVVLRWFDRGQLWESPIAARDALKAQRRMRPDRPPSWRPGGDHVDPRERFKLTRDQKRARFKKRSWGKPGTPDAGTPGGWGTGEPGSQGTRKPGSQHAGKPGGWGARKPMVRKSGSREIRRLGCSQAVRIGNWQSGGLERQSGALENRADPEPASPAAGTLENQADPELASQVARKPRTWSRQVVVGALENQADLELASQVVGALDSTGSSGGGKPGGWGSGKPQGSGRPFKPGGSGFGRRGGFGGPGESRGPRGPRGPKRDR